MKGTDHLRSISPVVRVIAAVAGVAFLVIGLWSLLDREWGGAIIALDFGGLFLLSAWIGRDAVDDPPGPRRR